MTNRKIINATFVEVDGIQMKSKIERTIYLALKEMGITPQYEGETFIYWNERRPKTPFYDRNSKRELRLNMKKLISVKYTPDFIFMFDGVKVLIEVKGWENDAFPLRKKLFRGYLDTLPYPVVYAEIFTRKQLLEFMEVLRNNVSEIKKQKSLMNVKRKSNPCTAIYFDGTNWEDVYALLGTPNPAIPTSEEVNDWLSEDDAIYVEIPELGNFAVRKNHWVVKDNTTSLVFQLTNADFYARYDIVNE